MLSIITINRNNEIGLEKTISSLRMQSNQDFEWIFIDGNSTDLSLALANQFTRVRDRLVSEPDGGIYNAMNKGVMLAHGECILFLNSGDIFANENCVKCIQNAFKKNVDLVLFGFSVRGVVRMPKPIWWRFWNLPTSHQAIVYRTSLLKDHRFDESYRFLADFEHFLRIHPERLKVSLVNQLLVVNEAYGTDQHLQAVAQEYRLALLIHGWPLFSAQFLAWIKVAYLKQVLK